MPPAKKARGFEFVKDKFERAALTEMPSERVRPPRVAECPIQLECVVQSIRRVGQPENHTAAIEVEVVRTHVLESLLSSEHRHHIDPDRWRPLIMSFLEFYGLGPKLRPSTLAEFF